MEFDIERRGTAFSRRDMAIFIHLAALRESPRVAPDTAENESTG
jgi:hypothetical protein